MPYFIDLDISKFVDLEASIEKRVKEACEIGVNLLVPAVHAHMLQLANDRLHSRREMFVDALSKPVQEGENTWLIILDKKARWIDDGMERHEMIDDLLAGRNGKPPKKAADGSRYRAIPFMHGPGKGPTNSIKAQQDLTNTIKDFLKKANNKYTGEKGVPYAKLEMDSHGNPRMGLLHSFDVKTPIRNDSGRNQGWGPIGQPRQGPTGIPFLQGVRIYQQMVKNKDGSESVKRAIMTFRTVSDKMKNSGRWMHPGLPPANIFKDSYEWGQKHWEEVVMPKVIAHILGQS